MRQVILFTVLSLLACASPSSSDQIELVVKHYYGDELAGATKSMYVEFEGSYVPFDELRQTVFANKIEPSDVVITIEDNGWITDIIALVQILENENCQKIEFIYNGNQEEPIYYAETDRAIVKRQKAHYANLPTIEINNINAILDVEIQEPTLMILTTHSIEEYFKLRIQLDEKIAKGEPIIPVLSSMILPNKPIIQKQRSIDTTILNIIPNCSTYSQDKVAEFIVKKTALGTLFLEYKNDYIPFANVAMAARIDDMGCLGNTLPPDSLPHAILRFTNECTVKDLGITYEGIADIMYIQNVLLSYTNKDGNCEYYLDALPLTQRTKDELVYICDGQAYDADTCYQMWSLGKKIPSEFKEKYNAKSIHLRTVADTLLLQNAEAKAAYLVTLNNDWQIQDYVVIRKACANVIRDVGCQIMVDVVN